MERTRFRLAEIVEWLVAAVCVLAILVGGAVLSRDLRSVRPVIPVMAGAPTAPVVPASVRPGAVAVPELVLPDGKRLVVGARAVTLAVLGDKAQTGPTAVERDSEGEREARSYRFAGMEFVVVTAGDRIVAIFR